MTHRSPADDVQENGGIKLHSGVMICERNRIVVVIIVLYLLSKYTI